MNEKSRQKFKYLEKRKELKVKQKAFFIIFVVLSVVKNCLTPESAPLTHFWSMFPFYTPWKHRKTFGFLVFSGGIKCEHWPEKGNSYDHVCLSSDCFSQECSCWTERITYCVPLISFIPPENVEKPEFF